MSSYPPRVFYFRHGETAWSLSGRHTGVTDVSLNEHGELQARALRLWTTSISFGHVLTSPRRRARETCELAGLAAQAIIEPDLSEWNYGDYEGRHSAEIREGRPGWNIFRHGCPNGESPDEIGARADRLIVRLRALGGDIALFAHGQFGSVFVARWIELATLEGGHFSVGPASMSVLSWDRNHPTIPVVALWNAGPSGIVCRGSR
jgi:probable phosphoglycerate mutase